MGYEISEGQYRRYNDARFSAQIACEKETYLASVDVTKTEWKTAIIEQKRLETYRKKLELREEQRERRKALVEELQVSDDGSIAVVTRNTALKVEPRMVTNMRNPDLEIYLPIEPGEPPCYGLSCSIGMGEERRVFLDSEKLARPSYLLRKLTAIGIYFHAPYQKVMPLLVVMLGKMAEKCEEVRFLPDSEGWVKWDDGTFEYFGEEDLTWGYVKAQSR